MITVDNQQTFEISGFCFGVIEITLFWDDMQHRFVVIYQLPMYTA
jgi:hypothetical protein